MLLHMAPSDLYHKELTDLVVCVLGRHLDLGAVNGTAFGTDGTALRIVVGNDPVALRDRTLACMGLLRLWSFGSPLEAPQDE